MPLQRRQADASRQADDEARPVPGFGTFFALGRAKAELKKRAADMTSGALIGCADLEARIPLRHPLRRIRQIPARTQFRHGFAV
ncbi:hypothetical protein [Rhodobacter sp. 24-YEA-8]|uniref:hypothetical protein n=1 Tax=Rhodobacter sp. 24-YEA-8 TaxID=1884310 RepID=UPI000B822F9C|nr:hypothetical protein [Rhodobacter sp. 24-YEA-8]